MAMLNNQRVYIIMNIHDYNMNCEKRTWKSLPTILTSPANGPEKYHQIHDWAGFSACVVCREGSISVIQGYRLRYHPLGQFFTNLVRVLTYIAQEHPPFVELLECAKRISESHFWWLKPRSTQLRDRTRNILESQGCQTQNCNEFEQFHCPTQTNYFTSNDPHHGIYTFSYWQIFWHSIWHIFWHMFWHIFWHIFWHSI